MGRPRGPEKHKTSLQITPEGKLLMERLAEKLGISQSAVFELALRQMAKREKIELE